MIEDIKELIDKYNTFKKVSTISRNGCSDDDYLYSNFLLGNLHALETIIIDLNDLIIKYDKSDK